MSTNAPIEIAHPAVIHGRLVERIYRLKEYADATKDGCMHMLAVNDEVDRMLALALELQTSINETVKFRRDLREAE